MDAKQLRRLKPELDLFLDRYAPLFGREEPQGHAKLYLQGLLLKGERRNVENIAESIEGCVVRSLQKFVGQGRWNDETVLEDLQRHAVTELGDPDGVINVDETGFPKKGAKSVGVKRQYAGCLGRVDNCQVGVFLNYLTPAGHLLLDRRLFLPEEWAKDAERRQEAGVPSEVVFRTKPELALEMVRAAAERGVPFRWVGGDSLYGDSPTFVQGVRALGQSYVLDVSSSMRVWLSEPQVIPAGTPGARGRPTTRPTVTTKPIPVGEVLAQLPKVVWQRVVAAADGSQGPRTYEYAEVMVWFSEEGLPSGPERLLIRRTLSQKAEIKYHRTNAAAKIPLDRVVKVAGTRWSVEEDFQTGKGECGLDEYETRGWVGWHHHTALAMLALWFLALQKRRLGEKRAADDRTGSSRPVAALAGETRLG
jgi:SRSO17 transposase